MKHATTTAIKPQAIGSAALPRVPNALLGRMQGRSMASLWNNPVHGIANPVRHDSVWCDVPARVPTQATTYAFGAQSHFATTRIARGLIGS